MYTCREAEKSAFFFAAGNRLAAFAGVFAIVFVAFAPALAGGVLAGFAVVVFFAGFAAVFFAGFCVMCTPSQRPRKAVNSGDELEPKKDSKTN